MRTASIPASIPGVPFDAAEESRQPLTWLQVRNFSTLELGQLRLDQDVLRRGFRERRLSAARMRATARALELWFDLFRSLVHIEVLACLAGSCIRDLRRPQLFQAWIQESKEGWNTCATFLERVRIGAGAGHVNRRWPASCQSGLQIS